MICGSTKTCTQTINTIVEMLIHTHIRIRNLSRLYCERWNIISCEPDSFWCRCTYIYINMELFICGSLEACIWWCILVICDAMRCEASSRGKCGFHAFRNARTASIHTHRTINKIKNFDTNSCRVHATLAHHHHNNNLSNHVHKYIIYKQSLLSRVKLEMIYACVSQREREKKMDAFKWRSILEFCACF